MRDQLLNSGAAASAVAVTGLAIGTERMGTAIGACLAAAVAFIVGGADRVGGGDELAPAQPSTADSITMANRHTSPDSLIDDDITVERPRRQHSGPRRAAQVSTSTVVKIAKQGNHADECEDAFGIDRSGRVAAIADGASSSFGARIWAQVLVDEFLRQRPEPLSPTSFDAWIGRCRQRAAENAGEADETWWTASGAKTGAYSAFLGASVTNVDTSFEIDVMAIGDCCAFIIDAGGLVRESLPFGDADQFGSHPALIGSAESVVGAPMWARVTANAGDRLVLATDAVSEWLLADRARFDRATSMESGALSALLDAERAVGRIVNDDLTIAVIQL